MTVLHDKWSRKGKEADTIGGGGVSVESTAQHTVLKTNHVPVAMGQGQFRTNYVTS